MSSDEQNNTLPAGLELFYELEKKNVKTPMQAFVLAVHWSVMRAGLRTKRPSAVGSTKVETTEKLPEGWTTQVDQISVTAPSLDYVNQEDTEQTYQLKMYEVAPNDTVVITLHSPTAPASSSSTNPRTSSAATFRIASYIRMSNGPAETQTQTPQNVYYNASEMEKKIWSELLEPLGLRLMGQATAPGPYDDKTKRENTQNQSDSDSQSQNPSGGYIGDPYYDPPTGPLNPGGIGRLPFVPPFYGGGLGRSDLDPLGVGTGMILDPRGFRPRFPLPPPGVPPGARYDPPGFHGPTPDHERPSPGFEDLLM